MAPCIDYGLETLINQMYSIIYIVDNLSFYKKISIEIPTAKPNICPIPSQKIILSAVPIVGIKKLGCELLNFLDQHSRIKE